MNWDYIAGFFDGEGNINSLKVQKWYQFQIRFYSTDKEILEKIREFLGYGQLYLRQRNERNNPVYELCITKKELIKQFLEKISPLLLIKRRLAEYALGKLKEDKLTDENFSRDEFQSMISRKKN